jgi:PadR family transcriptional regulator, regulatory protein AphA
MEKLEAYPITYGVLGLLSFWGPLSGYDIKRLFDHTMAPMWGAAHSQIYNELRRMKELGWVEMQREEQEDRPDRKVYSITEQGQAALRIWQGRPPEVYQVRDELLLKVMFGAFAPPGALAQTIREGIVQHEQRLAAYRQNLQHLPSPGEKLHAGSRPNPYAMQEEGDPYFERIGRFAVDLEKTYLRWLYETLDVLEGRSEKAGQAEER